MSSRRWSAHDRALGMDRRISRRDVLHGLAAAGAWAGGLFPAAGRAIGAASLPDANAAAEYPPEWTGMRGSNPGSFETAHAARDGQTWNEPIDSGENYDLVVVGAGISGLAAAHFYRERAGAGARILILDNHDDFGGHARRNEFHLDGRLHLLNGGTLMIDSPRPYSAVSDGLLRSLGLDVDALIRAKGLPQSFDDFAHTRGFFFDRETFGRDRLVVGRDGRPWMDFLDQAPLHEPARADLLRIERGAIDYLPGMSPEQKMQLLSRISYRDFLRDHAKVDPQVLQVYATRTNGEWGVGIDAVSALDCWGFGAPGFQGLKLEEGRVIDRMGPTPAGYASTGGSYRLHFPDGNATIARLLVRALIPSVAPPGPVESLVTERFDYSQLDLPGAPVRLRLRSTVVRARNLSTASGGGKVDVTYVRGGQASRVRASACVLACYNMIIPYLCPELPPAQKQALHDIVKVPLVYTSVALRNASAFARLGVQQIEAPGCFHTGMFLNPAMRIGRYAGPASPDEPTLLHMQRTPCKPGLPEKDQNRAGRAELLATSFETFERNIRDQLGRMLAEGGFEPARDITAITVNRWPHGYSHEYNPLFDPEVPPERRPYALGRVPLGRIAIANSDSGGAAYTDVAIDQAHRAVSELLASA